MLTVLLTQRLFGVCILEENRKKMVEEIIVSGYESKRKIIGTERRINHTQSQTILEMC